MSLQDLFRELNKVPNIKEEVSDIFFRSKAPIESLEDLFAIQKVLNKLNSTLTLNNFNSLGFYLLRAKHFIREEDNDFI
jgi:hypothetical protein